MKAPKVKVERADEPKRSGLIGTFTSPVDPFHSCVLCVSVSVLQRAGSVHGEHRGSVRGHHAGS